MWQTAITHGRWGLQETLLCTFPFTYLLAGYAVVRDKRHRRENALLAGLTVVLWLGHLVNPQGSSPRFGERYIFEGFFGVTLLATRGISLLARQQKLDENRVRVVGRALFALNGAIALLVTASVIRTVTPYVQVRARIAEVRPDNDTMVFLGTTSGRFLAPQFNINDFDWRRGVLYLVDPGSERRRDVAAAEGRSKWMVIGYDDSTEAPQILATYPEEKTSRCPSREFRQ